MSDAIFIEEHDGFRATELAAGPWSSDFLQGSATTALLARQIELRSRQLGATVRRLSFDLWRPARLDSFRLRTDVLRSGRKATVLQAVLLHSDIEIARCTALLATATESPQDTPQCFEEIPPEQGVSPPRFAQKWSRYFERVSVAMIEGALEKPGPAAAWLRLDVPLVRGESNTALIQAVQAADFASGVAQVVDMRKWTFINPEITIHFHRAPVGDWILVRARTHVGQDGAGVASARLADRHGFFAELLQAVIFERRTDAQTPPATSDRPPEVVSTTS